MIDLSLFHFLRPQWFFALIPLLLLIYLMFFRKTGNRSWEAICDEKLLPHILIRGLSGRRHVSMALTATGGLLAIMALAGPVWEKLPQPVFTSQNALVIALDLTRSMDASDVSPSRLERARFKIRDILEQREEGQTALLVYAGDAFVVTPLTDDTETIKSQLNALTTGIMPALGNRAGIAIAKGVDLLRQAGMRRGDVLLITDEVNLDEAKESAMELRNRGYRLSIMGVGTQHGVPVPLPDGGFLKGKDGEIIIPVLDEGPLRQLSASGGGKYIRLAKDDHDIALLTGYFTASARGNEQISTELETDVWREQGPWLVLCLLPLAALLFRRGYVFVLAFLLFPQPDPAYALDWDSLWLRKDQQGQRAMDAQDYEKAAELFNDPAWKAAAQHRSGDYQAAVGALEELGEVENHYNRGNSLARMGRYQEAIAAYDKALAELPEHEDAKFNKELLEKELEQQQSQQQDQGQRQAQDQQQDGQQSQQDQGRRQDEQGSEKDQQGDNRQSQQEQNRQQGQDQQQAERNASPDQDNQEQNQQRDMDEQEGRQGDKRPDERQVARQEEAKADEERQATEQWLRRIPDDPSGLLRRKFRYQYQQRNYQTDPDEQTW